MTSHTSTVSPFGIHRSVDPPGVLPYAARRLDPSLPLNPGEALIAVERLNIDSASFTQLLDAGAGSLDRVAGRIAEIVVERGKMHNPVTGSGGVLIGTASQIEDRSDLRVGDRVVTLTSLTTTPLRLDEVVGIDPTSHQVQVRGQAILFERAPFAVLDGSLPETLAMSVLDVCGAPAQARRLARPDQIVMIAGAAGKSGLLVTFVAAQAGARVIGLVRDETEAARLYQLPFDIEVAICDATDPVAVREHVEELTSGAMADLVFNCVNVPGVEMSCIMATRPRGLVYLFSMATSFQAAALGAEAVGADVDLMIGNGFAEGHAAYALELVRENAELRTLFGSPASTSPR